MTRLQDWRKSAVSIVSCFYRLTTLSVGNRLCAQCWSLRLNLTRRTTPALSNTRPESVDVFFEDWRPIGRP
jgi:hypothetical protein